MDSLKGIPRSRAIKNLFSLKLSDYPKFKEKLTTLEDNGALLINKTPPSGGHKSRGRREYFPEHLILLHNVVLISAIYPKPEVVLDIIKNLSYRLDCAKELDRLLNGRHEVGGIEFDSVNLALFLAELKTDKTLQDFKLSNPFKVLPQTIPHSVDGYLSVLSAFHLPEASASDFDKVMAFYLDQKIGEAYDLALTLSKVTNDQKKYVDLVLNTYHQAKEFDDVLESFFD